MTQAQQFLLHRQGATRPATMGVSRPAFGTAPAARRPLPLRPVRAAAPDGGAMPDPSMPDPSMPDLSMPDPSMAGTVAFADSAQAWFWTLASLTARREGTSSGGRGIPRPCDPDDVILALDLLHRRGGITLSHARVLRRWGERGRAPEPARGPEAADAQLWTEALNRLDGLLRAKRIVV